MSAEPTPIKGRSGKRTRPLNSQEHLDLHRAVGVLQTGGTIEQAAEAIGTTRQTLKRHLETPEGRGIVREYEADLTERTNRLLAAGQAVALRTLLSAMNEADRWSDRIRAADAFARLGPRQIIVTGGDGGPIEITSSTEALVDRLARMRKANIEAIETSAIELTEGGS